MAKMPIDHRICAGKISASGITPVASSVSTASYGPVSGRTHSSDGREGVAREDDLAIGMQWAAYAMTSNPGSPNLGSAHPAVVPRGDLSELTRTNACRPLAAGEERQVVRNQHACRAGRVPVDRPRNMQHLTMIASDLAANRLLSTGVPANLAARSEALTAAIAEAASDEATAGISTRGIRDAESAVRELITYYVPDHFNFRTTGSLRRWVAENLDDLADTDPAGDSNDADALAHADESPASGAGLRILTGSKTIRRMSDVALLARPRVLWTHPAGITSGLLIDRFHPAHLDGVAEVGAWARRKVIEDLHRAAAMVACDPVVRDAADPEQVLAAVRGVRVIPHRVSDGAIHFAPTLSARGAMQVGDIHRVGNCDDCQSSVNYADTTPGHATLRGPGPIIVRASHGQGD